jgi:sortase (surface protein transpeptidase)
VFFAQPPARRPRTRTRTRTRTRPAAARLVPAIPAVPAVSAVRAIPALSAVLAATAALAVLTGCSSAAGTDAPRPATPPPAATTTATTTTPAGASRPVAAAARPRPAAPTEVAIPSLGISAPLMTLGLQADGTVQVPPPDQRATAGWYTGGAVPGEAGAAVIIGHNSTRYGKAVFYRLKDIATGADITVTNARGQATHFTVTAVDSVSKKSFPTQKVYGPTSAHALRLITCDGAFDAAGHPVDNLIVYATQT